MTRPIYALNWINGDGVNPKEGLWIDKFNPHTGEFYCHVADSSLADIDSAIMAAEDAFFRWSDLTSVKRGQILTNLVAVMKLRHDELVDCISIETGKPLQDAIGEVGGAILLGEFFAGEGMRLYGRSLSSGVSGKQSFTIRQPHGIAGLIVPANTPIANIAWKTFPALICGNTVILKAAEDAPKTAFLFAEMTKQAGIPDGVFNVIQGRGQFAGAGIVEDPRIKVLSFTGSTAVGRLIAESAGKRLARVSLELGGKNPFVVCDDANLEQAVHWASLSAFSNAGQRCAAGSRIFVFEEIYNAFRADFIAKAQSLRLGIEVGSDLGPVINSRQHQSILGSIKTAKSDGGRILCGGSIPSDSNLINGYYVQPTIVEDLDLRAELNTKEIFGPLVTIHPVKNIEEALYLVNASEYGLTTAIHTQSIDRALWFAQKARAGIVNVNLGTFGSEPHMPFGGFGLSGNGTREPGVEALDVYSELKNISLLARSNLIK